MVDQQEEDGRDATLGEVLVFPGMGPLTYPDIAKFMLVDPFARRLTAEANDVLGYDLVDRFRESSGDYSEYAELGFLVSCVALSQWAENELGARPRMCAGLSFGGKAAAVYAGSLAFSDAIRMTAGMHRCEEEYFSREFRDVVTHSFARTPADVLTGILRELDEQGEWYDISCYVDEDFYMLSLRESKCDWLAQRLRAGGGLPLYIMRPPMHCGAFGTLRDQVAAEVLGDGIRFADPQIPVVADQDGAVLTSGAEIRTMLLDGYTRAVRWPVVLETLKRQGARKLYMCGQDALFGRVGCATRDFDVVAVNPRLATRPRRREASPRRRVASSVS